jgi:hypothetical protein
MTSSHFYFFFAVHNYNFSNGIFTFMSAAINKIDGSTFIFHKIVPL